MSPILPPDEATEALAQPPNACLECSETFATPVEVVEHARAVHTPNGPYAAQAAELHRIADDLAAINTPDLLALSPHITIQPHDPYASEARRVAAVDAVAEALFGKPGKPREMGSGAWHYHAEGPRGPIERVAIFTGIKSPAERDTEAELARLRAELGEAKKQLAATDPARLVAAAALSPDSSTLPDELPESTSGAAA